MEKVIRGYLLKNPISSNPFFSVYQAEHSVLAGQALRVTLFSEELTGIEEVKSAFNQAAFRLSFAEHNYIVKNIDLIEENNDFAILSENPVLRPIYDLIYTLNTEETAVFIENIFDALIYLNDRNIYHASLGPDSIFIDNENNPRIVNYGFAEILLKVNEPELREKVMEFLVFAAPELSQSKNSINAKSEVYSCGKFLEFIYKSLQNTEINPNLNLIIQKCLFAEPEKRYRSVKDLLSDFKRHQETKFAIKNETFVGFKSSSPSYKFNSANSATNLGNQQQKPNSGKTTTEQQKNGNTAYSFVEEQEKQKQTQNNTNRQGQSQQNQNNSTNKQQQSGFQNQNRDSSNTNNPLSGDKNIPNNKIKTTDVVIFGVLSMFFSFMVPFLGVILAFIGFSRASSNKKKVKSFGRAFIAAESNPQTVGIVLCILSLIISAGKFLSNLG